MYVPRCMSTQHPDNVTSPFFADQPVIQGSAEIQEAYYAYSHLGCTEQMWDCEGKEVDAFVVKKLLSRYERFFHDRRLGSDLFLTLRVPNPRVERAEAKVLLETLESIPRSFDAARLFYRDSRDCGADGDREIPPIFEVILPMTSSADELNRVFRYYEAFVGGKGQQRCHDTTIADWLGSFGPPTINVIPLIEEREHLLEADRIVEAYLADKELPWQRVFLARSDPALNYGLIPAVLLVKTALARLDRLERRIGIPIYPILGAGSVPFRGNLRPDNVGEAVDEYPSIQTFTIQSAFKYDHPEEIVRSAIAQLNETPRERAAEIDEDAVLRIADKVAQRYEACVAELAPLVNAIAPFVPPRRARKLHIGLFGYSRQLNGQSGIHLPRAIGFCASLYSLGLPPEILGLGALDRSNLAALRESYANLDTDMGDSLRLLCEENLPHLPEIVREDVRRAREWFPCKPHKEHARIAAGIWNAIAQGAPGQSLTEEITRAATYRRFLG